MSEQQKTKTKRPRDVTHSQNSLLETQGKDLPTIPAKTFVHDKTAKTKMDSASEPTLTYTKPTGKTTRSQRQKLHEEQEKKKERMIYFAVFALLAVSALALQQFPADGGFVTSSSLRRQEQISKRIEHHKQETGFRINLQRSKMEAENFNNISVIDPYAQAAQFDVMDGLGLPPEQTFAGKNRDRGIPLDPTRDAEARLQYQLAAEQKIVKQKELSREEFIKEFVQNAKRGGYDVRVKPNYDVEILRAPNSVDETRGSSGR